MRKLETPIHTSIPIDVAEDFVKFCKEQLDVLVELKENWPSQFHRCYITVHVKNYADMYAAYNLFVEYREGIYEKDPSIL